MEGEEEMARAALPSITKAMLAPKNDIRPTEQNGIDMQLETMQSVKLEKNLKCNVKMENRLRCNTKPKNQEDKITHAVTKPGTAQTCAIHTTIDEKLQTATYFPTLTPKHQISRNPALILPPAMARRANLSILEMNLHHQAQFVPTTFTEPLAVVIADHLEQPTCPMFHKTLSTRQQRLPEVHESHMLKPTLLCVGWRIQETKKRDEENLPQVRNQG